MLTISFFLLHWKIPWWSNILPISFLLLPFCSVMMPLGILLRFTDYVLNCIMISHDMFSNLPLLFQEIQIKTILDSHRYTGIPVSKTWYVAATTDQTGGVPTHLFFTIITECKYNYDGFVNQARSIPETLYYFEHKVESKAVRTFALEQSDAILGAYGRTMPVSDSEEAGGDDGYTLRQYE